MFRGSNPLSTIAGAVKREDFGLSALLADLPQGLAGSIVR